MTTWTFLSHHAQVFLCIAQDPDARLRDIAAGVGITERAVQAIVNDLVEAGYVDRARVGRRNHYAIHPEMQRMMAQRAAHTVAIDTDHSPFMSTPAELLAILVTVAQ